MKPSLAQSKLSLVLLGLALLLMACKPGKTIPTPLLTLFPILPTPTLPAPTPRSFAATPSPQNGGDTEHRSTFGGGQGGGTATRTRAPTRTPKSTSTRAPKLSPTSTETLAVPFTYPFTPIEGTPTPIDRPGLAAVGYQLKPWDMEQALQLVRTMDQFAYENDYGFFGGIRPGFSEGQVFLKLALQEFLFRYPEAPYREQIAWRLALANAILGNTDTDAWILDQVQTGLNQGITLTQLKSYLNQYHFSMGAPVTVPNLFGDGREAWVFWIDTEEYGGDGINAALRQDLQGQFHIIPILSHWAFGYGSDGDLTFGDNNQNDLPEITLFIGWHNGSYCQQNMYIYEWREDHFAELTRGGIQFQDCEMMWQYDTPDENGVPTILVDHFSGLWARLPSERFRWNGEFYELSDRWLNLTGVGPDSSSLEWLEFNLEQGKYPLVAEILEKSLPDWPEDNRFFGPSLPDFMRFQLGMSYALQLKVSEAQGVFESLVISPTNPLTPTISLAAQAFLDQYQRGEEVYRACQGAQSVMEKAISRYRDQYDMVDSSIAYQKLGYDYVYLPICSLPASFRAMLSQWDPAGTANIMEYLRTSGVQFVPALEADLDGNGYSDQILVIGYPWEDEASLWILQNNATGVAPLLIPRRNVHAWQAARDHIQAEAVIPPGANQPIVFCRWEPTCMYFSWLKAKPLPHWHG